MKKLMFCFVACVFTSNAVQALLPPLYSSLEEYRQLLDNRELASKLDAGQAIESIERVDNGFVILTPKYSLHVDVVREPQQNMGPAKFHLEFHDPIPR